jgi:dihydroorotate dehydrogenase (fumarate)
MQLRTDYLGLELKNPLVAAASPVSRSLGGIRQLEDAGVGAIVLPSLFEEQIIREEEFMEASLAAGADSNPEATTYQPTADTEHAGVADYLRTITAAKRAVDIPVIASLNGVSSGGWMRYAALMEEAGADALELNLYYIPTDLDQSGLELENCYLQAIHTVLSQIKIPLAVKVGPYFSSFPNMAHRIAATGASGLVIFNRFYQPDFDLDTQEVVPSLAYSRSEDLRLPLRWTAILYGKIPIDIAITTGVHTSGDLIKSIMAGATVAMMASELLQNGLGRVAQILDQTEFWMSEHEYETVKQMRGSMSQRNVADPSTFERSNYMKVLHSFKHEVYGSAAGGAR